MDLGMVLMHYGSCTSVPCILGVGGRGLLCWATSLELLPKAMRCKYQSLDNH